MTRREPPLLLLAAGRRARPRREAVDRPREVVLHRSVVDLLRKVGDPNWIWTHVASGEKRDPRTAAKLKALGVRRGWPDLILIGPDGRLACLEIKASGGVLSEEQEDFQVFCIRAGVRHAVVRSLDEVVGTLTGWGAILRVSSDVGGVSAPRTAATGKGGAGAPSSNPATVEVVSTTSSHETGKGAEAPLPSSGEARE